MSIYWNCLNILYKFPREASASWLRVNANNKSTDSSGSLTSPELPPPKSSHEAAAVHRQFPMEKWKPHDPAPSTGQHQIKPEANALVGGFFFWVTLINVAESGQRYKAYTNHHAVVIYSSAPEALPVCRRQWSNLTPLNTYTIANPCQKQPPVEKARLSFGELIQSFEELQDLSPSNLSQY